MTRATTKTLTITDGATASAAIELERQTPLGIYIDSSTLAGKTITFKGAHDEDGTYFSVKDIAAPANDYTIAAADIDNGDYVPFRADQFAGLRYLKVVVDVAPSGSDLDVVMAFREVQ